MKVLYGGQNVLIGNLNQKIVFVYALHFSQLFVINVEKFAWVEPVLISENKVHCV